MPQPPRIAHLEELESIPGPGSLTWHPVRFTLGIRAFGCNAYTAHEAGQDVVEPHTESLELAHEELYFVAAGRATFTIDELSYDAPAGSYVFVPDPASHRHAVAAVPDTTVLSFGGPPTFEPSPWEWSFRARPLVRSDPSRAREILADGLAVHPDAATLHYDLACIAALGADRDAALSSLRTAIERRAEVAEWAREDADLESLRDDSEFAALVNG
jgi:mannose-6-phosphate isomerase-like protein (cupin superfamily)